MAADLDLPEGVSVKRGLALDDSEAVALKTGPITTVMTLREARALGAELCRVGIDLELTPVPARVLHLADLG